MCRGRAVLAALTVSLVAVTALSARPGAASHDDTELRVTVAINAAGDDRLSVSDTTYDSTDDVELASAVAIALDRPPGSFRVAEDWDGADVVLRDKLARPDSRGGLSYAVDTGKLQLLADQNGYEAVVLQVCAPRVRQVVSSLVASQRIDSPGSRCRGWYQPVDEPPIRAVVQLAPDRHRYPTAVGRTIGAVAVTFGILGIGATLLRRGPLRRRSLASWLLAGGIGLVVAPVGWGAVTLILWWTGAPADPMLLDPGSVGEQVARTLLPGLGFVLPALLPAAILLTVAPKEKALPRGPAPLAAASPGGPPATTWWPAAWWAQWAAQGQPPAAPPPAAEAPTAVSEGGGGWAPPGSGWA